MMKYRRGRAVDCLWVAQHTDAYLDGELNKKAAAALDEHLAACPDCAAQVEEARELLALVSACDDVCPDATLHESVMRSVREQPREVRKPILPGTMRRWGAALVGVCLLLAVWLLPPVLLGGNAQEPFYGDSNGGNGSNNSNSGALVPSAPGGSGSDGGGHWWEDIFENDGANKDEVLDPENQPNEAPQEPGGNGGEGGTVAVLELTRVSGDGTADTLWERLDEEWQGDDIVLVIDSANNEAWLSTPKNEYYAHAYLDGEVLTLAIEGGSTLKFEVIMEGDTLWLTLIS